MSAKIVGRVSVSFLEAQEDHAREVKTQQTRAEVRRKFKRIRKLNLEAERRANGWEPGFHNRIRGLR